MLRVNELKQSPDRNSKITSEKRITLKISTFLKIRKNMKIRTEYYWEKKNYRNSSMSSKAKNWNLQMRFPTNIKRGNINIIAEKIDIDSNDSLRDWHSG